MAELKLRRGRKCRMAVLDLFYPNRCPCCGTSIPWDSYLCGVCMEQIETSEEAFCPYCGKVSSDCICGTALSYDKAVVLTRYADAARAGVLSLKRASSLQFAWYCGTLLGERICQDPELSGYDAVVPVPMYKRTKRKRCLNPAEALAREIAASTGIPLCVKLLEDNGTGRQQHLLSAKERAENVAQFFLRPGAQLPGRRILLCDDVLTTGSTMNRCAKLLKSIGAEQVAAVAATSSVLEKHG